MLVFSIFGLIACVLTENSDKPHKRQVQRSSLLTDSCRDSGIYCLAIEDEVSSAEKWRLQVYSLFNTCHPPSAQVFSKITGTGNDSCFDISWRNIIWYNSRGRNSCFEFEQDKSMINTSSYTINGNASLLSPTDIKLIHENGELILEAYHNPSELTYNILEVTTESIEYGDKNTVTCSLDNIAFSKKTYQKKLGAENSTATVNGVWNSSCDYTISVRRPGTWWRVDLEKTYRVRRAKIYQLITQRATLKKVSYFASVSASPASKPSNDSNSWNFVKYHHEAFTSITLEDFNPSVQMRHFAIFSMAASTLRLEEVMVFGDSTIVVRNNSLIVRCPMNTLRFGSSYSVSVRALLSDVKASPTQRFGPFLTFSTPLAPIIRRIDIHTINIEKATLEFKVLVTYPENSYCDQLFLECYSGDNALPCSPHASLSLECKKEVYYSVEEKNPSLYVFSARISNGRTELSSSHSYSIVMSGNYALDSWETEKLGINSLEERKKYDSEKNGWIIASISGATLVLIIGLFLWRSRKLQKLKSSAEKTKMQERRATKKLTA